MQFTRRQLLAGIGGGTLAAGGIAAARPADPTFTRYTYAAPDTDDRRLRVAWYERYNGAFLEHQNGTEAVTLTDALDPAMDPEYVVEANGPVVSLSNVVPGDSGTLVVGLEVVDEAGAEALDVYVRAALTENAENRVNGPELAAGDDPDSGEGELGATTEVVLWRDDVPGGSCDGQFQPMAGFGETAIAKGSMKAAFAGELANDGKLAIDCLSVGSTRCLSLSWQVPLEVGNVVQTDSIGFDVAFAGVACGGENPFSMEVAE
ncbi:hypothetical protein KY092_13140 [Natronomonas gomsonensis]|uniref:hypothetical protein n=1 Tax=Natronomonas gomsonensis TaxID=1046043 RepID=UPI0020CA7E1F|nr:hypothetical protein [Natronomonas gomsonensis]MCY4731499.1 hypothetical protein [Natronomonas gomsonensis]